MPGTRVGRRYVFFACVAPALAGACAAPTIPLPPPSLPSVSAGSTPDKVKLTSVRGVEPHALVVVYNRNPSVPLGQRVGGAEADEHGSWETEVYAKSGDVLDITQEFGSTRSPPTTLRVR
jgi:hypothetical protein